MTELKPCPFCGNAVRYSHNIELEPDGVCCGKCRMIVRFTSVKPIQKGEKFGDVYNRIAERWNRRTSDE